MERSPQRTCFALLATALTLAPAARGAVSVQVVRVDESRVKEFDSGASHGGSPGQVTLTLRLGGAEVAGASEYGRLRITEATDDTGLSIKPEQFAVGDEFTPLPGSTFDAGQDARRPAEIQVSLAAPSRSATRIARVKGEVYVKAGGRKDAVTVARVAERIGKAVEHPALKAAKLTVTIVDPKTARPQDGLPSDAASGGNTLTVKIVGDGSAVKGIEVVGPEGQSVSPGRSSSSSGNTTVHTLILERTLDPSMALKIDVLSGQRFVRVPLDLKDIPLP